MTDWPTLMTAETAAKYLDMGHVRFRALAHEQGLKPIPTGFRGARWRRADIDALVERLGGSDYEPSSVPAVDPIEQMLERISKRADRSRR